MSQSEEINNIKDEQTKIEAGWVLGIKSGDERVFEALFNFYCQKLINFTRRYVFDVQIAENIVQDVFVSVWNRRKNLDPSRSIKSYLFTSVKNEALKELRHRDVQIRSQDRLLDLHPKDADPEQELTSDEFSTEIYNAIDGLPEKCREIFMMNRFDGLKYAEIAEVLNISVKTVETQMGRALKKLRGKLKSILPIIYIVFLILLYLIIMS